MFGTVGNLGNKTTVLYVEQDVIAKYLLARNEDVETAGLGFARGRLSAVARESAEKGHVSVVADSQRDLEHFS